VSDAQADPILGFYGPCSQMWRINREAVLLGAGPAALLLQIAHPHVAEGVAQHSDFLQDPFRRLRGTLRTTMDLVFGDRAEAERAVRRLNGIHAGVRGEADDPVAREVAGERYRALDPELLLWVQATLIVTSVRAYTRWVAPLTAADREAFWAEARPVGARMGIPLSRSPADWAELMGYWERMLAPDGPIQVTSTARRLAPSIIRPPMPFVPGALIDLAALPGLALLPPRIRDGFGIPWGAGREVVAGALDLGIRAWVRIVPPDWRAMPQARSAERRVAQRAGPGRRARAGASQHGWRRGEGRLRSDSHPGTDVQVRSASAGGQDDRG
jgi:uncharacterized protein (DUF2236 family)